jgi:hypothetical protein
VERLRDRLSGSNASERAMAEARRLGLAGRTVHYEGDTKMKYKTGDRVQVGNHAGVITHVAPFGPINPQPQYTVQFDDGKKGVYPESEVSRP